ncbi:3-dehydroquinate synthase [Riemerella columbina]|uniref:3-dehydroquinate synthase n=1 Tax=Riemerella columbina TaxID=103810 RepID=UPI0026704D18|nr:3-dehydroquinate synthase [Riemerella columbina]WKS94472.1 3-dehydroquinate synthase [Riemerella columbina]
MISILDPQLSAINQYIAQSQPSQLLILVDENTHQHCLPYFLGNLETDIPFEIIEIEPGEALKTIDTAVQLWEILSEFKADRKALFINLGGGVITDMGGFVASTYKRGIPFIHMPTTLLSMVDASIGGKTGIDHQFLKNIVGSFALPEQIFVAFDFLKTLPYIELRSGFAEMLKHGLIAEAAHWEDLINIDELSAETIVPYIESSMRIKQNIVNHDFKENNIRKILNFGHTIGHAIESLFISSGQPIPHGEAVVLGMIMETHLSALEHLISEETSEHIISEIQKFYPYISIDAFDDDSILQLMKNDKKNNHRNINFSLLNGIGTAIFDHKASEENVKKAIFYYKNLQNRITST